MELGQAQVKEIQTIEPTTQPLTGDTLPQSIHVPDPEEDDLDDLDGTLRLCAVTDPRADCPDRSPG